MAVCRSELFLPDLLLSITKRRSLDHESCVLGDELVVISVGLVCLRVRDYQVKIGHFPELLLPYDSLLEVADTNVISVTGDWLIVQVIFELEPHRHFGEFTLKLC